MHLLEETTVRTEWTLAPGPVDAYEIQFIPTVREMPSSRRGLSEQDGRGGGAGRAHLLEEVPGNHWLSPDGWVPEAAVKAFSACLTLGTEASVASPASSGSTQLEHLVTESSILPEAAQSVAGHHC